MAYKTFQESLVWQKSEELVILLSKELQSKEAEWLKKRMMKAAITNAQHIAKGYEKNSKKELIRYLGLAKNQLIKLRSIIVIAGHMNYCTEEDALALQEETLSVTKLIQGLIRHLHQPQEARLSA